jgi:hypothetical protein
MERGDLPPVQSQIELTKWAEQLELEKGSADWYMFFDLASIDRGKIPDDLLSDEELVGALPLFFRTLRGQKPTDEDLDKVISLLRTR